MARLRPSQSVVVADTNGGVAHAVPVHHGAGSHHADESSALRACQSWVAIAVGGRFLPIAHGDDVLCRPCVSAVLAASDAHVNLMIAQVAVAAVAAVGRNDDVAFLVENHRRDAIELAVVGGRNVGEALRGEDACHACGVAYGSRHSNGLLLVIGCEGDTGERCVEGFAQRGISVNGGGEPEVVGATFHGVIEGNGHVVSSRFEGAQRVRTTHGEVLYACCLPQGECADVAARFLTQSDAQCFELRTREVALQVDAEQQGAFVAAASGLITLFHFDDVDSVRLEGQRDGFALCIDGHLRRITFYCEVGGLRGGASR